MTQASPVPVLELRGVTKRYGRVTVLRQIDFDLLEREVHGLIGENGAGKSTTTKLLAGVNDDYEGEMRIRGKAVRLSSPADALNLGIGMVYQELSLFPHLTVAENLFGRKPPTRLGLVDWKQMARQAQNYLNELGLEIDATRKMGELTVGNRQVVEIARVVFSRASVIILDEPTSALSPPEIRRLFGFIANLKSQGKSVIFISHSLEDVLAISDRITILKDGARVNTLSATATNKQHLVELMVGVKPHVIPPVHAFAGDQNESSPLPQIALQVDKLSRYREFEEISFVLHRGEVLGLFGFMGSGQIPLGHCLFGASLADSGSVALDGNPLKLSGTPGAVAHGIAFIPENRHNSLMLAQPIYANITLAHLKKVVGWLLRRAPELAAAYSSIQSLAICPPAAEVHVGALSGGNQQKVVLAKWLVEQPRFLILIEPTRGIDIAAKEEVVTVIERLRNQGVPVLLISSEPEVIERLAGRALVMRKGRLTAELTGSALTRQNLMQHA
jgi:ribose transport system ATP-binding protein